MSIKIQYLPKASGKSYQRSFVLEVLPMTRYVMVELENQLRGYSVEF